MAPRGEQDLVGPFRKTAFAQQLGELLEGLRVVRRCKAILFGEPVEQPFGRPSAHGAVLRGPQPTQPVVGEVDEVELARLNVPCVHRIIERVHVGIPQGEPGSLRPPRRRIVLLARFPVPNGSRRR